MQTFSIATLPSRLILLFLVMMISACGFHLRGHEDHQSLKPLTELHIKGVNRFDDIAANVKQLAKAYNISLTPQSAWSITLDDEELETWQASTTQSVSTSEYYLRLHVNLHIHHKDITYQPIHLYEQAMFQDNADESSSKNNEQDILIAELRQKLAKDVLRRVQYIANNPPECDCDEPEPTTAP
jgi:outer membrane lipopolysaccharide assembly protein LptE/RlpB